MAFSRSATERNTPRLRARSVSSANKLGLVRAVVVHDDMNVEIGGHVALDLVKELAELRRAVPRHAFSDNGSGLYVECREQRCRSVPLVVVRAPLDLTGLHRQQRLRAVERLHLGFLVDTQHNGTL